MQAAWRSRGGLSYVQDHGMRVAIIGNSGSGKSTLAQRLAAAHSLSAFDLDTVAWEPGKVAVPRSASAAAADVQAFCAVHDRWVVEGCYAGLVQQALEHSPILLFMDPGMEACLSHCRQRPWEPHKYTTKAEQDEKLEFLLSWVREYYSRDGDLSLSAHQALFDAYGGPKRRLTHEVERWFIEDLIRWPESHDVNEFGGRFEACTIAKTEWTHTAHLVVGLWHVHRYGAEEALARLRSGIRRLNESHGNKNTATDGYHETITAAYVQLLSQFHERCPAEMPIDQRAAQLLGGPLAARDVLLTFYSRDRLMSTVARAGWVEPDLAPLQLALAAGAALNT
jgi:adenylate kinase family enzyme